jgi:hypothetical protein
MFPCKVVHVLIKSDIVVNVLTGYPLPTSNLDVCFEHISKYIKFLSFDNIPGGIQDTYI